MPNDVPFITTITLLFISSSTSSSRWYPTIIVVHYVGPFSHNKPPGRGSGGPVKATTTVKMNFPAYSPPSNVHAGGSSRVSSPPVRSSSMREFHTTIRGEMAEGSHGAPTRPSAAHRSVSMSTQNLSDHERERRDNQSYHPQVANKPRRSQSFNEKSMSSGYGHGGGSLAHSGLSSSSASSTGSSGSNTMEYPSNKAPSHSHSHHGPGYRTYPLRETASLQALPSSASYGGGNAAMSGQGMEQGRPHQSKHAPHHGGHHGQIRSSSVRNIPSASGYNVTTTTPTSVVSTSSSSAGQSGRPIFSQPMSATAARVESVDIPARPGQPSATMAANVRDLSSSYPGHHGRAGPSSSRSATSSGGLVHGGSRGENPKQSRRHLHKVNNDDSYSGNLSFLLRSRITLTLT